MEALHPVYNHYFLIWMPPNFFVTLRGYVE